MTTHWRVNQGRRRTIAVPVQTEAATRTMPGRARSFRRSKSTSSGQEHEQAKDRLELPTTASASESAEDAKLNEILEEFERELWSHSRRLTRLQTPPKWVPPWAAAGCNPKPQVKLKPLSPVKRQRCSGPLLSRLRSKDGDDMLATVLNSLLPVPSQSSGKRRTLSPLPKEAVPSSPLCLSHERWSPSVGSPKFSVGSEQSLEVLEFLGVLTRRFGNLTRAFRAMKRAAGKGRKDYSLLPLSKAEFTWCVTSFLHHGNNTLACKLFAAMNRAEGIALCDLIEHTPEGLLSLQQVRQQLLEEWSREELEEVLQSHQQDEVSKQDFMNLAEDLGMESCQAWHLFELLEDAGHAGRGRGHGGRGHGGCIGMADLREAVLSDETRLLWHDLWKQLVARFGSIRDALRILESCVHSPECHVDEDTFANWMESWSICREEAAEYFDFLKGAECCNSDGSNESNLLEKLKNSLHSAAPKTSLEDFWQRVAAEWPELLEAAHAKSAPGQLADLLLELLPMEMRLIMKQMRQGSRQGTPRKVSGSHKRPQVTEHSTSGNVQSQSPLSLLSLDLEAFTALAMHIDVSPENSKELFESITRSASVAQSEDVVPEAQIYLDDFAEQMILWTEGVDRRGPMKEKIRFAPVRAVISALKAELLPAAPPSETPESTKATKLPKDRKEKKQRPQLPWCTYYHLRPNPVPTALT